MESARGHRPVPEVVPVVALAALLGLVPGLRPAAASAQGKDEKIESPVSLYTPPSFDSAVAHGTRSRSGAPGKRYWQNSADYDIQAAVTPTDSMLYGTETVTYHNASPDTLGLIVFHVYQNLMTEGAAREGPAATFTEGMELDAVSEGGRDLLVPSNIVGRGPRDSTAVQVLNTLMAVRLVKPILPGGSREFRIKWHFQIPGADAPRMGMQDSTTAQVAQWYPQIAVYDDLHGWDTQQYTGTGEFYLDYGHFRYSVTLPAGFVVGGSGVLQNPEQVLTAAERQALAEASPQKVVHVLAADDFGPGSATAGKKGDRLTWKFDADSVRDVAFSFSDHYLWDATRAVVDSTKGTTAAVNVMYRPGAPRFDQVAEMARAALETHSSRMVPYPYPQLTETEGGSGGMEYPMTVFVEAYRDLYGIDEVSAHEIGHEWFPMMVGSNETRYGWQDEGLNTFDTFFATDAFLPDSMRREGLRRSQHGYVSFAQKADEDLQMMSPANSFGVTRGGYVVEAYDKPSSVLWALRATLGNDLFYKAYRTYIRRWAFKHPSPSDFFLTFDDVTGRDLDAFFMQWFYGRDRLDQAVTGAHVKGGELVVNVRNLGGVFAPVDVTAELKGGGTVSWREPMSVWYGGAKQIQTSHAVSGQVTKVTLDAEHDFPDIDRSNNSWEKK